MTRVVHLSEREREGKRKERGEREREDERKERGERERDREGGRRHVVLLELYTAWLKSCACIFM